MSWRRVWVLIGKSIRLSPKNPILIFALIAPLLYTVIFQVLFGDFLKQKPVIAVYERGEGRVGDELRQNRAVETVRVRSRGAMLRAIKRNQADLGFVLPGDVTERLEGAGLIVMKLFIAGGEPGAVQDLLDALEDGRAEVGVVVAPGPAQRLDSQSKVTIDVFRLDEDSPEAGELLGALEATTTDAAAVVDKDKFDKLAGERPEDIVLKVYVNGESLAKDRTISIASLVDALRAVAPQRPDIAFEQISLGQEQATTLLERMLPFIVLIAVLVGAFLLPATFLVQEKEKKTLTALLVSPVSLTDVLVAFGTLGSVLAVLMGLMVLILNVGLDQPFLLLVPLILGSILMTEWGLTAGLLVKDTNSLFANIKLFGILFYAPAIVLLFPNWPQWIARVFPTYYIVNPVFRISIFGEGWSEIDWQIYVLVGFVALFFLPLAAVARRARRTP